MTRYERPHQVLYLQRHKRISFLGALGAVPLLWFAMGAWKGCFADWRRPDYNSSTFTLGLILAILPTLLGMFCFGMALGLLRHARIFLIDQSSQTLLWEERPLWILGRVRRKRIPIDRIHIHVERIPPTPVDLDSNEFAWIRIRDEKPILFMRTFGDEIIRPSPSSWAERFANDLGCPLTGEI